MTQESTPQVAQVTREHRLEALVCAGIKTPSAPATVAWLEHGTGAPSCAFAFEMAQALANEGARVRAESQAELERLHEATQRSLVDGAKQRDRELSDLRTKYEAVVDAARDVVAAFLDGRVTSSGATLSRIRAALSALDQLNPPELPDSSGATDAQSGR